MTAPIYIEQLLNDYLSKSAFEIKGGRAIINNGFVPVVDGTLEWSDGKGKITNLSPFTIQTIEGNDYSSGLVTPLFPYFSRGSVIDAVAKLSKKSTERLPLFILDTLDRREITNGLGLQEYNLRAFVVMIKLNAESDEWETIFDPYLDSIAEQMIKVLKRSMFTDYDKVFRERWGEGSKYGTDVDNVFADITNCIEITGTFTFNNKKQCL